MQDAKTKDIAPNRTLSLFFTIFCRTSQPEQLTTHRISFSCLSYIRTLRMYTRTCTHASTHIHTFSTLTQYKLFILEHKKTHNTPNVANVKQNRMNEIPSSGLFILSSHASRRRRQAASAADSCHYSTAATNTWEELQHRVLSK